MAAKKTAAAPTAPTPTTTPASPAVAQVWPDAILLPLASLVFTPWNVNEMADSEFSELVAEIEEFGFDEPVQVVPIRDAPGQYLVLGGEHRVRAANALCMTEIPAVVKTKLSDADEATLRRLRVCVECGGYHHRRSDRCAPCQKTHRRRYIAACKARYDADYRARVKADPARLERHRATARDDRRRRRSDPEMRAAECALTRSEARKAVRRPSRRTDAARAAARRYLTSHPIPADRRAARNALNNAVRAGRVVPPSACEICGQDPGCGADGRRLLRGDHYLGYAPEHHFDVYWVCPTCDGEQERRRGNTTLGRRSDRVNLGAAYPGTYQRAGVHSLECERDERRRVLGTGR